MAVEKNAKLAVGDLIIAVDGQPALPEALQRRRFSLLPIVAKVRHPSGETGDVLLP
jgi:hypothetical protein